MSFYGQFYPLSMYLAAHKNPTNIPAETASLGIRALSKLSALLTNR